MVCSCAGPAPLPIVDDGTHVGTLPTTVHLTLGRHAFHSGLMEFRLDLIVWQVLGMNC